MWLEASIAREADNVFYTLAGPEIAVATTKAYSTQLDSSYTVLHYSLRMVRGADGTVQQYDRIFIMSLKLSLKRSKKYIEDKERIQWFAVKAVANCKGHFLCRPRN